MRTQTDSFETVNADTIHAAKLYVKDVFQRRVNLPAAIVGADVDLFVKAATNR